jgi:hypothetical protein
LLVRSCRSRLLYRIACTLGDIFASPSPRYIFLARQLNI